MSKLSETCDEVLSFEWLNNQPVTVKQCVKIAMVARAAKVMEEALMGYVHEVKITQPAGTALSEVEKILNDGGL